MAKLDLSSLMETVSNLDTSAAAPELRKNEAARKAQEKQVKEYQAATQKNARRLLPAIDAAGLPDQSKIQWAGYGYTSAISVATIRKWAQGIFDDDRCSWYSAYLEASSLDSPSSLAKLLGCSTDYLLGVTDQLQPAAAPEAPRNPQETEPAPLPETPAPQEGKTPWPHWQTGTPPRSGEYLVRFMADGSLMRDILDYDRSLDRWTWPGHGAPLEAEVTGWYPIPQYENDDEERNSDAEN